MISRYLFIHFVTHILSSKFIEFKLLRVFLFYWVIIPLFNIGPMLTFSADTTSSNLEPISIYRPKHSAQDYSPNSDSIPQVNSFAGDTLFPNKINVLDSGTLPNDSAEKKSSHHSISIQIIVLHYLTGNPLPNLALKLKGSLAPLSNLISDSLGQIEFIFSPDSTIDTLVWEIELDSPEYQLLQNQITFDVRKNYQQWILEVQPSGKQISTPSTIPKSTDSIRIEEKMVVIADRVPIHDRKKVSEITLHRDELREVSSTQNDPFRVLGTLPGVSNISDLSVRPYVRGGDEHETRTFWNGVPILHPYHALSAYSIYNIEAIENLTIYTGGFPAEGNNSLSGALWLTSRPAPLDTTHFWANISLLKGHAYLGAPVVKNKFGVYIAYQAFWYDFLIKRFADYVAFQSEDPDVKKDVENYKKYTDLPNFKDLEFGFQWAINQRAVLDYSLIYAKDLFRILDPNSYDPNLDPIESLKKVDTLAFVEIPNQIHGLNLRINASSKHTIKGTLSYQGQDWWVTFPDSDVPLKFDLNRQQIHGRILNLYQYSENHLFNFGAMLDYTWDKYDVNVPRVAYEILLRGNYDLMETVGLLNPNGYVITKSNPWNSLGEIADNLVIDVKGQTDRLASGAWFSDRWIFNQDNRFDLGGRIDFEASNQTIFASPRISWFHRINPTHEFTLATGLYNQDNFEFQYRHYNPKLKSEKAIHTNLEYSWDITENYRLEFNNYFKWYYDLVGIRLVNTEKIQASDLLNYLNRLFPSDNLPLQLFLDTLEANINSNLSEEQLDSIVNWALQELPEDQREMVLNLAGKRSIQYSNMSTGYALGSEIALRYQPTKKWRGWLSLELSQSKRKDRDVDFWYNFRNHRPWQLKWHNYIDLPSNWEMSLRIQKSAGLAYTGFTSYENLFSIDSDPNQDTVWVIERKNNKRYTSVTRFDMRFERNSKLFGRPFKSYFEIWNMFNDPNFLLIDNKSGNLKWFTFSYPFPIIFTGFEIRY